MNLWICFNCHDPAKGIPGYPFEGEHPVCPACTLDGRTGDGVRLVVPRVAIHFDPPHAVVRGRGSNLAACDGKPIMGRMGTGEPSVVTCPACKATDAFRDSGGKPSGTVNQAPGTRPFLATPDGPVSV